MPESIRINCYGDMNHQHATGFGCDIASQRRDDLDMQSVDVVRRLRQVGKEVRVLDVGCGVGGHSVRLATAGAHVIGVDLATSREDFDRYCVGKRVVDGIEFIQADMRQIDKVVAGKQFHIVYSQRSIHYLPWHDSVATVRKFHELLLPGGHIFLSASGLGTTLGNGYIDRHKRIEERFAPLSIDVATSDKIAYPVTLYKADELKRLLIESGFESVAVQASEFGNIKGYGQKPV